MPPRFSTGRPAAHVTATPVIFEPAPPAETKPATDKNLRLEYFESDNIQVIADVPSKPFLSITIFWHPTALARIGEVTAAWALLATLLRFASDLLEAKAPFENAAPIFQPGSQRPTSRRRLSYSSQRRRLKRKRQPIKIFSSLTIMNRLARRTTMLKLNLPTNHFSSSSRLKSSVARLMFPSFSMCTVSRFNPFEK